MKNLLWKPANYKWGASFGRRNKSSDNEKCFACKALARKKHEHRINYLQDLNQRPAQYV